MPIIEIHPAKCKHCGTGRITLDIKEFKKEWLKIPNTYSHLKCHKCYQKPIIGEVWGLSINNGHKNTAWCPSCAIYIENQLNIIDKKPRNIIMNLRR